MKKQWWLFIICALIYMITLYALACYKQVARSVPVNYITLALFTFSFGYLTSGICLLYYPEDVLVAASMTGGMVVGLTVYAIHSESDYSSLGAFLFGSLFLMVFAAVFMFVFPFKWLHIICSIFIVMLLCIFVIYDT